MAAIKFLLGFICTALIGSFGLFNRHLLKREDAANAIKRDGIICIAEQEIGVREKTGHNDGQKVEEYLAVTGLKKGEPWCAAYVSWVYRKAGFKQPCSAWSPDLFPRSHLVKIILPGDVLGIYFPELKRIAHVGLIIQLKGDWITSVEGNTNVAGSREGDGVYVRKRHIRTIASIADWVQGRRKGDEK